MHSKHCYAGLLASAVLMATPGQMPVRAQAVITTIAGNGSFGSAGDGGAATSASLGFPSGVAVDSAGNV